MNTEAMLTFMATFGSAAFMIKMVLMMIGGDHTQDMDVHDHSGGDQHDSTVKSFLIFSTQTIFAFLMTGGLTGLAALNAEYPHYQVILSTLVGGLAGGGLSSFMMKQLNRLNSVPERKQPSVGDQGVAYLPMQDLRVGQVMVRVDGREELYEAVSKTGLIRAFEDVKVVGKQNNRLVVESLNK